MNSVGNELKSPLATSTLMRQLCHDLGSNLWQIAARDSEIATGRLSAEQTTTYAIRNVGQLRRYQSILDNLRLSLFPRPKEAYSFETVPVTPVILDVCAAFDSLPELEQRGVRIAPPKLVAHAKLSLDSQMFSQCLYNMIENAIEYSFRNTLVQISSRGLTHKGQTKYVLDIVNGGVGMLEGEIKNRLIFLQGYRGTLTESWNRRGNGLGLAVAETVIRNHGGAITVKSIPSRDLSTRKSEYAGVVSDISLFLNESDAQHEGFLNRFTIILPWAVD